MKQSEGPVISGSLSVGLLPSGVAKAKHQLPSSSSSPRVSSQPPACTFKPKHPCTNISSFSDVTLFYFLFRKRALECNVDWLCWRDQAHKKTHTCDSSTPLEWTSDCLIGVISQTRERQRKHSPRSANRQLINAVLWRPIELLGDFTLHGGLLKQLLHDE